MLLNSCLMILGGLLDFQIRLEKISVFRNHRLRLRYRTVKHKQHCSYSSMALINQGRVPIVNEHGRLRISKSQGFEFWAGSSNKFGRFGSSGLNNQDCQVPRSLRPLYGNNTGICH